LLWILISGLRSSATLQRFPLLKSSLYRDQ